MPKLDVSPEAFRDKLLSVIDEALTHAFVVSGERRALLNGLRTFVLSADIVEIELLMECVEF